MLKNPPSKKDSGRASSSKKPSVVDGSPLGAIHSARPTIIIKGCLQFIVEMGLAPTFQRFCDEEGIIFNIELYYNDKRPGK